MAKESQHIVEVISVEAIKLKRNRKHVGRSGSSSQSQNRLRSNWHDMIHHFKDYSSEMKLVAAAALALLQ
jgi:hypothetical protein